MKTADIRVLETLVVKKDVHIEISSIVINEKYFIKFDKNSVSDLYLLNAITKKHYVEILDELNDRFDEDFSRVKKITFAAYNGGEN